MSDRVLNVSLAIAAVCFSVLVGVAARSVPQGAGAKYQVLKACSILTLAEVKKLAPWAPHLDQFAKGEEEPLGNYGSSCEYATFRVQVMAFNPSFVDSAKKSGIPLEKVSGVGDEAYVRNNKNNFTELVAKVGPHNVTVQLSIGPGKTYESTKAQVIEIGKAYAAKLR